MIFFRSNYSQFWLTLQSNEALGLLDTDFIEDYFGVDGQVTIHHLTAGARWPMMMSMDAPNTFIGVLPVENLPNGKYKVEGRVRDTLNNYSILSAFQNPQGFERVLQLNFEIIEGFGVLVDFGMLTIRGGYDFDIHYTPPVLDMKLIGEMTMSMNGTNRTLDTTLAPVEIKLEFEKDLTNA